MAKMIQIADKNENGNWVDPSEIMWIYKWDKGSKHPPYKKEGEAEVWGIQIIFRCGSCKFYFEPKESFESILEKIQVAKA